MPQYLGVDYGEKRIGLALSDESGSLATPLNFLPVRGMRHAVEAVAQVCREKGADVVVVGLPLNMDGSRGPAAEKAELFAERLATECALPVNTWDERLSSRLVERMLVESDVSRSRRKLLTDKLAAQVILQSYIDARAKTE